MLNILFSIAALIMAPITALLSIFFNHDTVIPHQASSHLNWDSPAGHICVAHSANIAVTGSPQVAGARAMTNMIHEVLNLTLYTYPFVPVRGLVTGTPTQRKDAERVVLGSWLEECEKLNRNYCADDCTDDGRDADDLSLRLRAADLAADVFLDPDARVEYLLVHWPRIAKAGGVIAPPDDKARTKMVQEMDQWCSSKGF